MGIVENKIIFPIVESTAYWPAISLEKNTLAKITSMLYIKTKTKIAQKIKLFSLVKIFVPSSSLLAFIISLMYGKAKIKPKIIPKIKPKIAP